MAVTVAFCAWSSIIYRNWLLLTLWSISGIRSTPVCWVSMTMGCWLMVSRGITRLSMWTGVGDWDYTSSLIFDAPLCILSGFSSCVLCVPYSVIISFPSTSRFYLIMNCTSGSSCEEWWPIVGILWASTFAGTTREGGWIGIGLVIKGAS